MHRHHTIHVYDTAANDVVAINDGGKGGDSSGQEHVPYRIAKRPRDDSSDEDEDETVSNTIPAKENGL